MRAFRRPLPDAAGPNGKPDIYLKSGLAGKGLAISNRRGAGGGFVLVDPGLDTAKLRPRNGLYTILPHELFHLVEFAYVPRGAPAWISEGVANTMATMAWGAWAAERQLGLGYFDRAIQAQYELWLRNPWLSLFSDELDCPRCYGNLVWWGRAFSTRNLLQRMYEVMAELGARVGLGVEAVDRALSDVGTLNNERTLRGAFGSFWTEAFRTQTLGTLAPLRVTAAEVSVGPSAPSTRRPPPPGFVPGLASHFVPFAVPSNVSRLRVVVHTDAGPEPRIALFVGSGRFSNLLRETRRTDPSSVVPMPFDGRPGRATSVEVDFVTASERENVVLMVANGRTAGMRYRVSYRPLQPATPPRRYCGATDQRRELCFVLAGDGTTIANAETAVIVDDCRPSGAFLIPIRIPTTVRVRPDGTFTYGELVNLGTGVVGAVTFTGRLGPGGEATGAIRLGAVLFGSQGVAYDCRGEELRWTARPS